MKKFGRNRPLSHGPRFRMARYMDLSALPAPPAIVDYTGPARSPLSNVFCNDALGCCVISGMAHLVGLFTGNAGGPPLVLTDEQIIALYGAIGGYVPGDPNTDNGCDEVLALGYWQQHGAPIGSHRIAGWLAIDPTNVREVQTAMWLFENLFFGIELPDAWVNINSSGFVWDAGAPNPNNGHCVVGVGYGPSGIQIDTWGMIGTMTYPALARNVGPASGGELYAVLSPDMITKASGKAPNGFDWRALIADFDAIGGNVPLPPAPPAPTPVPVVPPIHPPTPPIVPPAPPAPTKAQVVAAVEAAINNLWK